MIKKLKGWYTTPNILRGMLIYASGDTIACFISDSFSLNRLLGMIFIGGVVYALEIPNYFDWINRTISQSKKAGDQIKRTLLAMAYFNPVWIARHLLFINLFTGSYENIGFNLLWTGLLSFAVNIPVSLAANWVIQNYISTKYRFIASATFSALMAIYYSLSEVLFK